MKHPPGIDADHHSLLAFEAAELVRQAESRTAELLLFLETFAPEPRQRGPLLAATIERCARARAQLASEARALDDLFTRLSSLVTEAAAFDGSTAPRLVAALHAQLSSSRRLIEEFVEFRSAFPCRLQPEDLCERLLDLCDESFDPALETLEQIAPSLADTEPTAPFEAAQSRLLFFVTHVETMMQPIAEWVREMRRQEELGRTAEPELGAKHRPRLEKLLRLHVPIFLARLLHIISVCEEEPDGKRLTLEAARRRFDPLLEEAENEQAAN